MGTAYQWAPYAETEPFFRLRGFRWQRRSLPLNEYIFSESCPVKSVDQSGLIVRCGDSIRMHLSRFHTLSGPLNHTRNLHGNFLLVGLQLYRTKEFWPRTG